MLLALVQQSGKLLGRERLVTALGADGAQMSERNVDLLINRLRRKLGDKARNPRFIATHYGEGYTWIAERQKPSARDAFLLVGPVYGLDRGTGREPKMLAAIIAKLGELLGPDRQVVHAPQLSPVSATPAPRYALEVSFHDDGTTLHAAFVLRHTPAQSILHTLRITFKDADAAIDIEAMASLIKAAIWMHLAKAPSGTPIGSTDLPMELRVHEAALMLAQTPESWRESEAQLVRARAERPDDPQLAVMWGLHLYTQVLQPAPGAPAPTLAQWAEIEDTIEALALDNLAAVQENPLLVLAIAKLLLFIDRGHLRLAETLVDEAFAKSIAFAAAFATKGQIQMFRGKLTEAVTLYDKAIEMSEAGSEFQIYLLILKCTALMAANDRKALDKVTTLLYALKPITRVKIGLMVADPKQKRLPPDLEIMLTHLDGTLARVTLDYLFNVSARQFEARKHRRNIMAGLTAHLVRRFGKQIVPDRITRSLGLPIRRPASEPISLAHDSA